MSIDPRLPAEREPLTPEERELAQRLSRLGPSAGPPSSVDARILAAAHEAVASRRRPKAGSARRWPVALGVAASLVLAVGIAWRLRPLPEPPQLREAAAAAAADSASVTSKGPAPASEYDAEVSAQAAPEQAQESATAIVERQDAAKQAPKREREAPPAADMPPIMVDEARAIEVPAPAAPPPPPPAPAAAAMAPPAGVDLSAADAAAPAEEEKRAQQAEQAAAGSAQHAKSAASNAKRAAEASELRREPQSFEDVPIVDTDSASDAGDEPPAYANSPEVREAWLRRVRELIAEGNLQQAHDSLHEFQRRYPDQPLPEDLQRFQQTKPDPVLP